MRVVDIIEAKKKGEALSQAALDFFVQGVTDESIPDYQISAFLMAVYFQGMTPEETTHFTQAMTASGHQLDLSALQGVTVDKHSTGGVGDKVSIALAPLVASVGIPVPMISGRGLGHTGGTLDKLEAIPGYQVEMSEEAFIQQVADIQCAIIGPTGDLAPADKKLYALRDVTATIDSIPLISGSIMSKKIAAGADAMVMDVKCGEGAFMKTQEQAEALAQSLVAIGQQSGLEMVALITDMNQPLGDKVGNALEIEECIDLLKGQAPQDITDLTLEIASHMLVLGKKAKDTKEARELLDEALSSGRALEKFGQMIEAQGGDAGVIEDPTLLPQARYQVPLEAREAGVITRIQADAIGQVSMKLGGGREKVGDDLDYSVGLHLHKKVGDPVEVGERLLTIHSKQEDLDAIKDDLYQAYTIGEEAPDLPLIKAVIR